MVMPEMDGLETARRLRSLPGVGQIPIIAVSASASDGDVAEAMKAGVNDFIAKPIDIKKLMAQLAVLLKLDWICVTPEAGSVSQHRPDEPLVVPPLEEMAVLHRLAREGGMRDIIRQAARLEELDDRYRPFAGQLRTLAQGYQSRAILELVERYINSA
jgi:DNA-binding NarL/FixJ family response regulator